MYEALVPNHAAVDITELPPTFALLAVSLGLAVEGLGIQAAQGRS
jgi:hypothetical protein